MIKFIEATFKGVNGTCGYYSDKKYLILMSIRRKWNGRYEVDIWRAKAERASVGGMTFKTLTEFFENFDVDTIL